jgi:hypothetical protein
MARKIIVSLIGGQTIPNVLFIKEMEIADRYIFITSSQTKKLVNQIILACPEIGSNYLIIEVDEYNLKNFDETINEYVENDPNSKYYINITGGTKIMSLATFNYFSLKNKNNENFIYYVDGGRNQFRQIYPSIDINILPHKYSIDLSSYLKANNVKKENGKSYEENEVLEKNKLLKSEIISENLYSIFSTGSNKLLVSQLEKFHRDKRRGKIINLDESREYSDLFSTLEEIGFNFNIKNRIDKNESKYLTGDWFEEYIFCKMKALFQLPDKNIALGLNTSRENAPNEFDVLFTFNNNLYYIECKSSLMVDGKINNVIYNEAIYKAAALRNEFGTYTKGYLFCSDDFSKLSDVQKDRAKLLRIIPVGSEIISKVNGFKELFSL